MITPAELCEKWKLSRNTLDTLLRTVPKYRLGRQIRYKAEDINKFLEDNQARK